MKIAIIDSGIDRTHPKLNAFKVQGTALKLNKSRIRQSIFFRDSIGHGSAIASIVHKHVPNVELVIVKIFYDDLVCDEALLCEAIKWCLRQPDIRIINMSLGLRTDSPNWELKDACEQAYKSNVCLVASSYHDYSQECYPAYFPTVFGVGAGITKVATEFRYIGKRPISFFAKGSVQKVAWKDHGYNVTSGSSYACAHFTGILANEIVQNGVGSIDQLTERIIAKSTDRVSILYRFTAKETSFFPNIVSSDLDCLASKMMKRARLSWIRRLGIFPVSEKELSSFNTFSEFCDFEVTLLLDYPRQVNFVNGRKMKTDTRIVRNFPTVKDFDVFDTMLFGYHLDQVYEANLDFGNRLFSLCLQRKKNIVCLDKKLATAIQDIEHDSDRNGVQVYCPDLNEQMWHDIMNFRYLPRVSVPVLAVIGTSSRQGKFSSQLVIRKILESNGYRVKHISTEPHGEFLGADFSFPIGYDHGLSLPRERWKAAIICMAKFINHYQSPDVIITGTQGGILPFASHYRSFGTETKSLDFLSAIKPDALVCCINPEDSHDRIMDTISVAKAFTGANTIFYALYPFSRQIESSPITSAPGNLRSRAHEALKSNFEKRLQVPVFDIFDSSQHRRILATIQRYFSRKI